jgi:hypothetical protein
MPNNPAYLLRSRWRQQSIGWSSKKTGQISKKTGQIYFYSNRYSALILIYIDTGISEHGIFHGILARFNN